MKKFDSLIITVEADKGAHIFLVAEGMCELADLLGRNIELEFNAVRIKASPGMNAAEVAAQYWNTRS